MGDVPTGDGIERVLEEQSLLTPSGGEGGSVPRTLGSKAEERAKRRKKKKDSYAKYLESATWRKIRRAALKRDKHTCRACKKRAQVVHHVRYPQNLGEEKMEWLYSLCVSCHDEIHSLAKSMLLREATDFVLGVVPPIDSVTRLPDDWRLSKRATKRRQLGKKPQKPKKYRLRTQAYIASNRKLSKLQSANDQLHEIQKRARENRERRGIA